MAQQKNPNEENIQVILDKLKAYIRILYRTGNTDEKIKRKLAKGNWKLEIINEVMEEVKYEMTLSDETKKQVVHLEYDIERAIHKDIEKIFDREVDKEITTKIEAQIEGEVFDDLEVAIIKAIQKIKPGARKHLLKKEPENKFQLLIASTIFVSIILVAALLFLAKTNPAFDTTDGKEVYFFNTCGVQDRFDCSITYYDEYFEMHLSNTRIIPSTVRSVNVGGCEQTPNLRKKELKLVFNCEPQDEQITIKYSLTGSELEKEVRGSYKRLLKVTPILRLFN